VSAVRDGGALSGLQQRFALALRLHFLIADAGLEFQQLQLLVRQLLAARSVLGDPMQPQALLEHTHLQLRIFKTLLCRAQILLGGAQLALGGLQLSLELFDDLCGGSWKGGARSGPRCGIAGLTHDEY
jgi:hypothetical protein